jgi:hypothetical protein
MDELWVDITQVRRAHGCRVLLQPGCTAGGHIVRALSAAAPTHRRCTSGWRLARRQRLAPGARMWSAAACSTPAHATGPWTCAQRGSSSTPSSSSSSSSSVSVSSSSSSSRRRHLVKRRGPQPASSGCSWGASSRPRCAGLSSKRLACGAQEANDVPASRDVAQHVPAWSACVLWLLAVDTAVQSTQHDHNACAGALPALPAASCCQSSSAACTSLTTRA